MLETMHLNIPKQLIIWNIGNNHEAFRVFSTLYCNAHGREVLDGKKSMTGFSRAKR